MVGQRAMRSLRAGQVDLWFCATDAVGVNAAIGSVRSAALSRCEAFLSDEEVSHSQRLRFPQHQREYILSHALLRTTLSRYVDIPPKDWTFSRNEFGKPGLIGVAGAERLRFNLSHTQGLSVCAVCLDADLGVDVEYHANRQSLLDVADEYFSAREIADLRALPEEQQGDAFFRYWTLKESYIKARGEGLSIPLDSFSFQVEPDQTISFAEEGSADAVAWQFHSLRASVRHSMAVAIRAPVARLNLLWSTIDDFDVLKDVSALQHRMQALLIEV